MNRSIPKKSESDEFKCKEQLYALFYELTSEIKGKEIEMDEEDYFNNIRTITMTQLVSYLRDTIHLFIQKTANNDTSPALLSNQIHNTSQDIIDQYEAIIKHYEQQERSHLRRYYMLKFNGEALENKIEEYIDMEEEFEEMKTKYKYEGGKFLQNDRKDNEIIILRAENTNLKNVVNQLEQKGKGKEKVIAEMTKEMEVLKETVEELTRKLDKSVKDLGIMSQININISNTANNSSLNNNNNNNQEGNTIGVSSHNNNVFKCSYCGNNNNSNNNNSPNKCKQITYIYL